VTGAGQEKTEFGCSSQFVITLRRQPKEKGTRSLSNTNDLSVNVDPLLSSKPFNSTLTNDQSLVHRFIHE
jgi:hypothetical protein